MTLVLALDRGLITDHEFSMLTAIDYYAAAFAAGRMLIVPGQERTGRAAKCLVCNEAHGRGRLQKFFMQKHPLDRSAGWRYFDDVCLRRIHERVVAQRLQISRPGPLPDPIGTQSGVKGVPPAHN